MSTGAPRAQLVGTPGALLVGAPVTYTVGAPVPYTCDNFNTCHPPTELMTVRQPAKGLVFSLGFMAGGDTSGSVAGVERGYFVYNGQIAEASPYFLALLDRLPNPAFTIIHFEFSNFDTAHGGVDRGWFELLFSL